MSDPVFAQSTYFEEMSDFRLAFSKAGCLVSMLLVLLGAGLDYSLYPAHLGLFMVVRVIVVAMTWVIYLILGTNFGHVRVRSLTLLWLGIPQVMIAWMINMTDGVASMYFVGLNLALYATGIIMPISFLEGLGFGAFTYIAYLVACLFHPSGLELFARFVAASMFILFSGAASALCTYYNERARNQLFRLRREVAEKNASLITTNVALTEIKGQMVQQEKMAALGTLSAGLMHEVNNPVTYALMALEQGFKYPEVIGCDGLKECLADTKEGLTRVKHIVTDLKTFAYRQPDENTAKIFLLSKAVQSAQRLSSHDLHGVDVRVSLPKEARVRGDEASIIGVLINLFNNAALALKSCGRERPCVQVTCRSDEKRLFISVRDNGSGISPENLTHVFEPFFTTRNVGQGLGLGLSVSYAIIQRHGGTLRVASQQGSWTEFTFDLKSADRIALYGEESAPAPLKVEYLPTPAVA